MATYRTSLDSALPEFLTDELSSSMFEDFCFELDLMSKLAVLAQGVDHQFQQHVHLSHRFQILSYEPIVCFLGLIISYSIQGLAFCGGVLWRAPVHFP